MTEANPPTDGSDLTLADIDRLLDEIPVVNGPTDCRHRYVVQDLSATKSKGVCKLCGLERTFNRSGFVAGRAAAAGKTVGEIFAEDRDE